jgi:hypothetical protein
MPNYNLLFIEKDIAYYNEYKEKNFEHVKNEAAAVGKMKELDIDVIVFNNDNEKDKDTSETLGERLYKKFVNEKKLPLFIAYTSSNFVQKRNRWRESFADVVYETDKMITEDIKHEITVFLRRRDRISNNDGLITRVDRKGVIKYYFGNNLLQVSEKRIPDVLNEGDVKLKKPSALAQRVLDFYLNHKGEAKYPDDNEHYKNRQDTFNSQGISKAQQDATKYIGFWRNGIVHILINPENKYRLDRKLADEIALDIIGAVDGEKPPKYKYNNDITERDFQSYKESKYNKEASLVSKNKG